MAKVSLGWPRSFRRVGTRRRLVAAVAAGVAVLAGIGTLVIPALGAAGGPAPASAPSADSSQTPLRDPDAASRPHVDIASTMKNQAVPLPPAASPPAPTPPAVAQLPALRPHEVFAFLPYWSLPYQATIDVSRFTTVAYFGVDINGSGSIITGDTGWDGYRSAALAAFIDRAHAQGDRVVLSAECFDQGALDQLASDPGSADRLAGALGAAVKAESFDGVNLDFEGLGSADRAGMARLFRGVADDLHSINPRWQVTVDTYGSSAEDSAGFFDVRAIAASVDAFFVMAYDMGSRATPSPTAPLDGPGITDARVLSSYVRAVPAAKVLLGIPFYGYQWPISGPSGDAGPIGPPSPVTYSQVVDGHLETSWDQVTQTPSGVYQAGGTWYRAFFDDPSSVALKAAAADRAGTRGVGVWALGMAGNDPAMTDALLGHAPPLKDWVPSPSGTPDAGPAPAAGPTTPPTTTPPPPNRFSPYGPTNAATPTASSAGLMPSAYLCSLLADDVPLAGTMQSMAGSALGGPAPVDLVADFNRLRASAGCAGGSPAPVPGGGPAPGLCQFLGDQAQVAGVLQGVVESGSGPLPVSLGDVVGHLAASGGCTGVGAPAGIPLTGCAALSTALGTISGEASVLQHDAEAQAGRPLGADLAALVAGLGSGCSDSPQAGGGPPANLASLCTLLTDLNGEAQVLQQAAAAQSGQAVPSLPAGVQQLGSVVGCP